MQRVSRSLCLLSLVASLGLVGCATPVSQSRLDKPHHTAEGFQNLPGGRDKPGFGDFLTWQRERLIHDLPLQDASRVPKVPLDQVT